MTRHLGFLRVRMVETSSALRSLRPVTVVVRSALP